MLITVYIDKLKKKPFSSSTLSSIMSPLVMSNHQHLLLKGQCI